MGIVGLAALVKQGTVALIIGAVALIEVLRGRGHVDELYTQLGSQLLHLVAVVVGVGRLRDAESCLQHTIDDGIILVAQVVTTRTRNLVVAAKIATAYGRDEDGDGPFRLDGIDNLRQTLLVGRRRRSAASVALHGGSIAGIAIGGIVGLQLQIVNTIVLTVVVGKLYEHIVAGLYIVLGVLPQLVVAATRVASTLGIVDAGPPIGEEVAKIHSPATSASSVLVVRSHRGVTQRMHLTSLKRTAHQKNGQHRKHQSEKLLFHKRF